MNNEMQIMKIMGLREKGFGYKRIAKELDMTVSAVRYAISKSEDDFLSSTCKECGVEIKSLKGKRRKVYCSNSCRWKWWNKQTRDINKKAYYNFICKNCGKEFKAYGTNRRLFCDRKCYNASRGSQVGDTHE